VSIPSNPILQLPVQFVTQPRQFVTRDHHFDQSDHHFDQSDHQTTSIFTTILESREGEERMSLHTLTYLGLVLQCDIRNDAGQVVGQVSDTMRATLMAGGMTETVVLESREGEDHAIA
jgi:hypothetical protein